MLVLIFFIAVKNALDLEHPLLNKDELEIVEKHIPPPNNQILRVKVCNDSDYNLSFPIFALYSL